jgi:hypothetical protein
MSSTNAEPELWQPDHDACTYNEYTVDLLASQDRVHVRMWHDDYGRMVDFRIIQLAALGDDGEEWAEVVKVDCHLNRVHIHRFGSTGKELNNLTLCEINGAEDVTRGYEMSLPSVWDNWEENRRRWDNE